MADRVLVTSANATLDIEVPTGTRNIVLSIARLTVCTVIEAGAVFLALLALPTTRITFAPTRNTRGGWDAFGAVRIAHTVLAFAASLGVAAAFGLSTV